MAPADAESDVEALYKVIERAVSVVPTYTCLQMLEDYKATAQRYQERCAEANAALAGEITLRLGCKGVHALKLNGVRG